MIKVNFLGIGQISHEGGHASTSPHMISEILIEINGQEYECKAQQSYGDDYETSPIQLILPPELRKKVHYEDFRELVERYYRYCFRELFGDVRQIGRAMMSNNLIYISATGDVRGGGEDGAW